MKKITLITAASALLLASGAWADSAMDCMQSGNNPGQNMQAHFLAGKDKGDENPAQHVASESGGTVKLGEMIQMMCSNPSPMHPRPPAP